MKKHPTFPWKSIKCPECLETITDTTCFCCDRELRIGTPCEHPRMHITPGDEDSQCIHLVTCSDTCFGEILDWRLELLNEDPRVKSIKATLLPGGHGHITPELWNLN